MRLEKIEYIDVKVGNVYNVVVAKEIVKIRIDELGDTRAWTWTGNNAWGTFLDGPLRGKKFSFSLTSYANKQVRGNVPASVENHGPGVWLTWVPSLQ